MKKKVFDILKIKLNLLGNLKFNGNMKRRTFLQKIIAGSLAATMPATWLYADSSGWKPVPPADLSRLTPDDFRDDELEIPYFLAHFYRLANGIIESGANRGFIDIPVWRGKRDNEPYNARIMENILSLVFFYTTKRPWNPYFQSSELRKRIEASMKFWCSIQNDDGRFSEYGPQKWNLAATGFATHFMGETLGLLNHRPNVSVSVFRKALNADREAIKALLTKDELFEYGRHFANQYTNAWPGSVLYLDIIPDPEIERLLKEVITTSMSDFQSPAGYFYEKDGPDWNYNLGVHESNLMTCWHYLKDTELASVIQTKATDFFSWLSYNAVLEPGTNDKVFFVNKPIETRTSRNLIESEGAFSTTLPLGKPVKSARPFIDHRKDVEYQIYQKRKSLKARWPRVEPLNLGEFSSYIPHFFQHRREDKWYPSYEQRSEAVQELPYIRYFSFVHQRMDSRLSAVYTFIKKPGYYVAFNSGKIIQPRQRYGIGLIWVPGAGTILQGQTGSDTAAWGTYDGKLSEAGDIDAWFELNGKRIVPKPGNKDFPDSRLTITYTLGNKGKKTITFGDHELIVEVQYQGTFKEIIPLVKRSGDEIKAGKGRIQFRKRMKNIVIICPDQCETKMSTQDMEESVNYAIQVCTLTYRDHLTYKIKFPV